MLLFNSISNRRVTAVTVLMLLAVAGLNAQAEKTDTCKIISHKKTVEVVEKEVSVKRSQPKEKKNTKKKKNNQNMESAFLFKQHSIHQL
ncbi:hypothetical protein [Carboxylicivirga marina]|uniref:Uncharacterized protein n=1 Tax=Carboxylicivirga marina TaxID=2800988 RepID=A0ABS1HEI6_9BACT|nr:hypothetical protein [Carboxylicivirga marina]MBK3516042.1 hypothetical protein [Carboxylicivirga marina]